MHDPRNTHSISFEKAVVSNSFPSVIKLSVCDLMIELKVERNISAILKPQTVLGILTRKASQWELV